MKNSAIGSNWKDVRAELFTKEEILESNLRVAIMTELIEARHEKETRRTQWGQSTGHRSDGDRQDQSSIGHGLESLSQSGQDPRCRPTGTRKGLNEIRKNYYGYNTNLPVALPSPVELSGCAPL